MPPLEEMVRMRIVFRVPGMEAAAQRRNLTYKAADGQPLHMDVYAPPGPAQARPAVILVHGGPIPRLGAKDMGVFLSYGELLAASGFVAVTFNHRFLSPDRLADAGDDVADLITHLRENAASLDVDPDRLALWAFSGGGPFLAASLRDRPAWLRALVAYYAVLDLQQPPPGADSGIGAELRQAFSPAHALSKGSGSIPPVLIARAGLDNAWINSGIDRFVQSAVAQGVALDLLNHPEGRHGFDILDDDARSRQIIRNTLEFLRGHLAP